MVSGHRLNKLLITVQEWVRSLRGTPELPSQAEENHRRAIWSLLEFGAYSLPAHLIGVLFQSYPSRLVSTAQIVLASAISLVIVFAGWRVLATFVLHLKSFP